MGGGGEVTFELNDKDIKRPSKARETVPLTVDIPVLKVLFHAEMVQIL
jgi:hypothetical protein